ncbi:hypothetical protein SLNWT_2117 [Streptomyces albus]|uniref:Uncharacterized protein n=1 Tax=Streptomyces albus (strain ATCC 21838 / DSM 41398 / FERM P-419 / JCM 4703 / NBRC 107858) TaxID=1081613 RepID=A0A0B5EJP4_STRA4|nr:hypothetical protein SLNWT_2117 [Streptomyces albus]AOU76808.1 hypothetical protein SLNHY_2117 [Streptomyces albus]
MPPPTTRTTRSRPSRNARPHSSPPTTDPEDARAPYAPATDPGAPRGNALAPDRAARTPCAASPCAASPGGDATAERGIWGTARLASGHSPATAHRRSGSRSPGRPPLRHGAGARSGARKSRCPYDGSGGRVERRSAWLRLRASLRAPRNPLRSSSPS